MQRYMMRNQIILLGLIILQGTNCSSPYTETVMRREVLYVETFSLFKQGHEITSDSPSMEEIVSSMKGVDRGGDPFETIRNWLEFEPEKIWKGEDWIDLGEGALDAPPIVVEKVTANPLTIKVIFWSRIQPKKFDGIIYSLPYHRFEHYVEMKHNGWSKMKREVKTGPMPSDRVYLYDERTVDPDGKGRVVHRSIY